jgi:hypothetical protein
MPFRVSVGRLRDEGQRKGLTIPQLVKAGAAEGVKRRTVGRGSMGK